MISECQASFSETKRFGSLDRPYSRSSIKKSALTYVATLPCAWKRQQCVYRKKRYICTHFLWKCWLVAGDSVMEHKP